MRAWREVNQLAERHFGVGIDLGTSMSAVSRVDISSGRYDFQEARDLGSSTEIPSAVYVHPDGQMDFGSAAVRQRRNPLNASRVVSNFKLLLRENEPLRLDGLEVVVEPVDLVRGLLGFLKECLERHLRMTCSRAVVTVPAHQEFDTDYRSLLRNAAMGSQPLFDSLDIIHEPDAVLMSIGDLTEFADQRVLVFDMGGGTLDVSIREVEIRDTGPFLHQLAVTGSDAAGRQVTDDLADALIAKREQSQQFTYSDEDRRKARQLNFLEVDEAKKFLSGHQARDEDRVVKSTIWCPSGRQPFDVNFSSADFAAIVGPTAERAMKTVQEALDEAGLVPRDIDTYFMVGGSSQLSQIRNSLIELFEGRPPSAMQGKFGNVSPTLAVVRGAAIADLDREDETAETVDVPLPELEQLMPYPISLLTTKGGLEEADVLVPRGSNLPYGPVNRTYYVPSGRDTISFSLLRGEGAPEDCVTLEPHLAVLPAGPSSNDEEIDVQWFVDKSGVLTLSAHDALGNELITMRESVG